jgi:hypothetical protein
LTSQDGWKSVVDAGQADHNAISTSPFLSPANTPLRVSSPSFIGTPTLQTRTEPNAANPERARDFEKAEPKIGPTSTAAASVPFPLSKELL